jgi:hypothetical protein
MNQISIIPSGFELVILESERPKTHVWDQAVAGIGDTLLVEDIIKWIMGKESVRRHSKISYLCIRSLLGFREYRNKSSVFTIYKSPRTFDPLLTLQATFSCQLFVRQFTIIFHSVLFSSSRMKVARRCPIDETLYFTNLWNFHTQLRRHVSDYSCLSQEWCLFRCSMLRIMETSIWRTWTANFLNLLRLSVKLHHMDFVKLCKCFKHKVWSKICCVMWQVSKSVCSANFLLETRLTSK